MPKGKTYYKLTTNTAAPNARTITKFDDDLNVISSYHMTWFQGNNGEYYDCACPASTFLCRHKRIMADITARNGLDSDKFWCFETSEMLSADQI